MNRACPDVFGAAGSYDIIYLLGYAAAGLGERALTGPNLAKRLMRMNVGERVDVGPENINRIFTKVADDGVINFNGASGPLDFNNALGEAASDIQIWCIPRDPLSGKATVAANSGRYYSAEASPLTHTLAGSIGAICQ